MNINVQFIVEIEKLEYYGREINPNNIRKLIEELKISIKKNANKNSEFMLFPLNLLSINLIDISIEYVDDGKLKIELICSKLS